MERYTISRIGKIISKINIVKWLYYPNHSTGLTNPYQTISSAFHRVRAKNFKISMETQETLNRQINLEGQKKKRVRGISLTVLRLYYKATVINTVWCWHRNRNIGQWNKTESPEIRPCNHGHLDVDREGKNIQWRKDGLFNMCFWGNWTATPKLMNL